MQLNSDVKFYKLKLIIVMVSKSIVKFKFEYCSPYSFEIAIYNRYSYITVFNMVLKLGCVIRGCNLFPSFGNLNSSYARSNYKC